jgi:GntR family transcriptional regulator, transcriptional repressor for pyruvate dehydrogenase complex
LSTGKSGSNRAREKPKQIADEIRSLLVDGDLSEGDSLGREQDLIERFGVSRPSLREALRILETEGLISVTRGVLGGVVAHEPDRRMTARTAAMVLQTRNVSLADVYTARSLLEPIAARSLAESPGRKSAAAELGRLIADQEDALESVEEFGQANGLFHERLVSLAGNQTLSIVAEMLNEIVARAVVEVSRDNSQGDSVSTRRRGIQSQKRLAELIEAGDAMAAEEHWRQHMKVVGRVLLGQQATTVIDLMNHV